LEELVEVKALAIDNTDTLTDLNSDIQEDSNSKVEAWVLNVNTEEADTEHIIRALALGGLAMAFIGLGGAVTMMGPRYPAHHYELDDERQPPLVWHDADGSSRACHP
jgi:hypothetical protein